MHGLEQLRPGEGKRERTDNDAALLASLEELAVSARQLEAKDLLSPGEREAMKTRLGELNKEIYQLVEEVNILEHPLGAYDLEERGVSLPQLSGEEHEKIEESRRKLRDKLALMEWERENIEKVLFPQDHDELERTRRDLGLAIPYDRKFRQPDERLGSSPAKPPDTPSTPVKKEKGSLFSRLKRYFSRGPR